MGRRRALETSLILMILGQVYCVRISPKLDFGNEDISQNSAGFRPSLQSRSFNYENHEYKHQGGDITCTSGNCNITDKQRGVATDVLVHVKTNVDLEKNKSTEAVPDIPVIIGSKTNEPSLFNVHDPYHQVPPPFPIQALIQNENRHKGLHMNIASDYNNYLPGYQGNPSAFNYNGEIANGNLPLPQFTWNNPKRTSTVYNPIEFNKVYSNPGPVPPTGSNFPSNGRNEPWGPCLCPNSVGQYNQVPYTRY